LVSHEGVLDVTNLAVESVLWGLGVGQETMLWTDVQVPLSQRRRCPRHAPADQIELLLTHTKDDKTPTSNISNSPGFRYEHGTTMAPVIVFASRTPHA
jgi:hypothetical protein